MSKVFIVFQATEESRLIVEAIKADNPNAEVSDMPGLLKVDAEEELTIKQAAVEEQFGRSFDLRELHLHLVSISGNLDEDDDEFKLSWKSR